MMYGLRLKTDFGGSQQRGDSFEAGQSIFSPRSSDLVARSSNIRVRRPRTEYALTRFKRRSEEHTSELQSRLHLVCRLLLEKKKKKQTGHYLHVDYKQDPVLPLQGEIPKQQVGDPLLLQLGDPAPVASHLRHPTSLTQDLT